MIQLEYNQVKFIAFIPDYNEHHFCQTNRAGLKSVQGWLKRGPRLQEFFR